VFYALALAVEVGGAVDPVSVGLAWGYVGARVVHSLVQGTVNIIPLRFSVFAVGTFVLMALWARTVWAWAG
jgi:hypothetical protein